MVTALAPIIWGSTYLVTTEFLPPGRPLLASTMRALPAGLMLVAYGRVLPRGSWRWRLLVLGVLNIGAFFYFLFVTAYHLPGGVAALVMSIQPLLVLLLSVVLLNDRVLPLQVASCLIGVGGVALLVLEPQSSLDTVGVLAGLAGATSMAIGIVLTKRWGRPPGMGLLTFTGWQLTVGGLVLVPAMLFVEGMPSAITGVNLTGLVYLGAVGALFGYAIWFRGIERLPALAVSIISFASPLCATVLGYVVLGQHLTPLQLVGGVTIVVAVVMAQPRRRPATQPPYEMRLGAVTREDVTHC